jgi:hypothetical protein
MPRLNDGPFGDNRMPLISRKNQKLPLVDKRGRLNVEIRGLPKTFLYWGDLFHTLVNVSKALLLRALQPFSLNFSTYTSAIFLSSLCPETSTITTGALQDMSFLTHESSWMGFLQMPNSRFIAILFCTYCLLFFGFAIPYYYDVSFSCTLFPPLQALNQNTVSIIAHYGKNRVLQTLERILILSSFCTIFLPRVSRVQETSKCSIHMLKTIYKVFLLATICICSRTMSIQEQMYSVVVCVTVNRHTITHAYRE